MVRLRDAWHYLTSSSSWTGPDGMLHLMSQQLLISLTALLVALLIGLPIAAYLGHIGRFGFLAVNIAGVGRAVPTFALLGLFVTMDSWKDGIPLPFVSGDLPIHLAHFPGTLAFGPYGRAGLAVIVALALFALPPIITNTYVAVREVDVEARRAASGVGMSGAQLFWRIELPLALPLIWSGARLALVQVWATATIAALVDGPGLGTVITDGFFQGHDGQGIAGAAVVAAVALLLELLAALVQRAVDPLGPLRGGGSSPNREQRDEDELSAEGPTVTATTAGAGAR